MNDLKTKLEMFCRLSGVKMEDVRKLFVGDVKQVEKEKRWLTIRDFAKRCGVCQDTIRRQVRENKIKFKRIRSRILIDES